MNPPAPVRRRSYLKWILLGFGILLTPVLGLGMAAVSMLTLDRDAAVLRREVMAASDSRWHTKVQVSVGRVTLGAVRLGLTFAHHDRIKEARLALEAVRHASVGVYERDHDEQNLPMDELLARTDRTMKKRGLTRLVSVAEGGETVLIYSSGDASADTQMDLCVAVMDHDQLVVVSTTVSTDALMRLVEMHVPKGGLREKLKLARL